MLSATKKRERQQRQLTQLTDLWRSSECAVVISVKQHTNHTFQQIRLQLRPINGTLFLGKNTLLLKAADQVYPSSTHNVSSWARQNISGTIGVIFLPRLAHLGDVVSLIGETKTEVTPQIGKTYDEDIWVRAGPSCLLPTQTGGFRCRYNVPSKITRGRIEFMSDFQVVAKGRMVDQYDFDLCSAMGLTLCHQMRILAALSLPEGESVPLKVLRYSLDNARKMLSSQFRLLEHLEDAINKSVPQEEEVESYVPSESLFLSPVLKRFEELKSNTHCVYASTARLWASDVPWQVELPLLENCTRILPAFRTFLACHKEESIDGFVIELNGAHRYAASEGQFEDTCLAVITCLQSLVPSSNSGQLRSAWYYPFADTSCFMTAFAPCYPPHSSRHMAPSSVTNNRCYLFLQAEDSFARRKIISSEPAQRRCPLTESLSGAPPAVCGLIRQRFQSAGQSYITI